MYTRQVAQMRASGGNQWAGEVPQAPRPKLSLQSGRAPCAEHTKQIKSMKEHSTVGHWK